MILLLDMKTEVTSATAEMLYLDFSIRAAQSFGSKFPLLRCINHESHPSTAYRQHNAAAYQRLLHLCIYMATLAFLTSPVEATSRLHEGHSAKLSRTTL
jgi:hypothetical protein